MYKSGGNRYTVCKESGHSDMWSRWGNGAQSRPVGIIGGDSLKRAVSPSVVPTDPEWAQFPYPLPWVWVVVTFHAAGLYNQSIPHSQSRETEKYGHEYRGTLTVLARPCRNLCDLTQFLHTLTLKMAACSSETLVSTHTRLHGIITQKKTGLLVFLDFSIIRYSRE
jgi:hypothetical protein